MEDSSIKLESSTARDTLSEPRCTEERLAMKHEETSGYSAPLSHDPDRSDSASPGGREGAVLGGCSPGISNSPSSWPSVLSDSEHQPWGTPMPWQNRDQCA